MTPEPPIVTPSARPEASPEHASDTAAARLTAGLVERSLVQAGAPAARTPDALRGVIARASADLRATPEGAALAERIRAAVLAASPLVATASVAHSESRQLARRAAELFVGMAAEHSVDSPTALARLMSAARWSAEEEALHAARVSGPPLTGDALDRALRLADRASTRAAYDLDKALALQREVIALRPKPAAFAWPAVPLVQPDPFPSRPRVPVDEAEDEQIDDEQVESDDEAEPNPVVCAREDEEPERKPAVMVVPEVWSSALPSGVAMGGRRGMAPAFAIVPIDPTTGRAQPTRPPGPTPEAKREMRSKGWEWSDGEQRWVSTKGANGDE